LTLIGLIAVMLLIGMSRKKRDHEGRFCHRGKRAGHVSADEAILEASLLRFRPILMTTLAAILGAIPWGWSFGNGAELRSAARIAIVAIDHSASC